MTTISRFNCVNTLLAVLIKQPKLKTSAYRFLVRYLSNDLRIQAYKQCMEDSSLAHHASGIQRTFYKGAKGGFEEHIGGNGSMGSYKIKQRRK